MVFDIQKTVDFLCFRCFFNYLKSCFQHGKKIEKSKYDEEIEEWYENVRLHISDEDIEF